MATPHTAAVGAHSAKADICCYVLRTPTPKEMSSNDPLNQIATLTAHRGKTKHAANERTHVVHQQLLKAIWPGNLYSQYRKINKIRPLRGLLDEH